MANKIEKELAYDAGKSAFSEPVERRSVDSCPFAPGTDEREEWLRGFSDALEEQHDVADLRRSLKEARTDA